MNRQDDLEGSSKQTDIFLGGGKDKFDEGKDEGKDDGKRISSE